MDTRTLARWGVGAVGLVLAYHEIRRAPLVLAVTVIAVGASAWVGNTRSHNRSPNRTTRRYYPVRLAALLSLGLWVGVFLVLSVADSGSESPISTEVPVGLDGAGISSGALLIHGLLSSAAILALMLAFTATGRRNRRREGRGSHLSALATKRAANSPDKGIDANGRA